MGRVPIDEVRLYKVNEGFPHAKITAVGYFCESKVLVAAGSLRADPFQGYDDAMHALYSEALLIPRPTIPARTLFGNIKTVVD
jgi:hypothetical protein